MAPLYKRYIPPKFSAPPVQKQVAPQVKEAPQAKVQEPAQKRKRERSGDEIAERKAKKLRKKGIDPATVELAPAATGSEAAKPTPKEQAETASNETKTSTTDAPGEFGHIKDSKKRHKLEKEARKARIAAEKQAKADQPTEGAPDEDPRADITSKLDKDEHSSVSKETVDTRVLDEGTVANGTDVHISKRKKRRKDESSPAPLAPSYTESVTSEGQRDGVDNKEHGPKVAYTDENTAQYDEALSQPRKRRHKLESAFSKAQDETPEAHSDDEHLRRHGGVFQKFQKAQKRSDDAATRPEGDKPEKPAAPQPVLRDLAPLPKPEKAPTPDLQVDPNASLPAWLANPTVVSDDERATFAELSLDTRTVKHLSQLGFNDTLSIQRALIPLLLPPGTPGARYLPGTESVLPDIAVGAPTGSGKTMAYLLPIIQSLRQGAATKKLKALVVVPTRELVVQVAAVAESLAKGSSIKIGMASGSGSFSDEQNKLIARGRRYDQKRRQELMEKAHVLDYPPLHTEDTEEAFDDYVEQLEADDIRERQRIQDVVSELAGHVTTYGSAVDILVATPGRLLEHLASTLGFTLGHIEWLVLDEADSLFNGQYSKFLRTIDSELSRPRHQEEQDARERYLRSNGMWDDERERRVRKVVLSATMARDVSKLMDLKLKRPQMLLVRSKKQGGQPLADPADGIRQDGDAFELPPTLGEYSVHVGDGNEKPLFLIEVLRSKIFGETNVLEPKTIRKGTVNQNESDDDEESDSDISSVSSGSSSSRESSDDESTTPDERIEEPDSHMDTALDIHPSRAALLAHRATTPTILIFTSSTESAKRLSHLLRTLQPQWSPNLLALTSSSASIKSSIAKFPSTEPIITIATDRAARGLDALGSRTITHVLQYDVPRSVTNYVHRVGRTARAGGIGEAWTLVTHAEAKWFVGQIVKGDGIRRSGALERVSVKVESEAKGEEYRKALEGMRDTVYGGSKP